MDTITRWLKRIGIGGGLALACAYIVFCAYTLPSHVKVHVTGTEISRKDKEDSEGRIRTQDVRYIMAEDLEGKPRMFRNQDTGWGWPPYFKFDSGNLAAQATNLSKDDQRPVALITYYGFRIPLLSAFPNVVSMQTVPANYQSIPWFTIFFVIAHLVLIGIAVIYVRDFKERLDERG